jgi:hypothetical protein
MKTFPVRTFEYVNTPPRSQAMTSAARINSIVSENDEKILMPRIAVPPSAAVGSPPTPSTIDRRGSHEPSSILAIGEAASPVPAYVAGLKNTFVHAEVKNPIVSIPLQMSRSAPVDETMLSLPPGLDDASVRLLFDFHPRCRGSRETDVRSRFRSLFANRRSRPMRLMRCALNVCSLFPKRRTARCLKNFHDFLLVPPLAASGASAFARSLAAPLRVALCATQFGENLMRFSRLWQAIPPGSPGGLVDRSIDSSESGSTSTSGSSSSSTPPLSRSTGRSFLRDSSSLHISSVPVLHEESSNSPRAAVAHAPSIVDVPNQLAWQQQQQQQFQQQQQLLQQQQQSLVQQQLQQQQQQNAAFASGNRAQTVSAVVPTVTSQPQATAPVPTQQAKPFDVQAAFLHLQQQALLLQQQQLALQQQQQLHQQQGLAPTALDQQQHLLLVSVSVSWQQCGANLCIPLHSSFSVSCLFIAFLAAAAVCRTSATGFVLIFVSSLVAQFHHTTN